MKDLTGQVFGHLTVLSFSRRIGPRGQAYVWNVQCSCGRIYEVQGNNLTSKAKLGHQCEVCYTGKIKRKTRPSHGHRRRGLLNITYTSWIKMLARCYNPKQVGYHSYGGRGIQVCFRWRNSFANFLADMGERPKEKTLDRINNNGNYEPNNCKWSTKSEQRINQRKKSEWNI